MKNAAAVFLVLLCSCGSPDRREPEPATWTYERPVHEANVVKEREGYDDRDGRLFTWRAAVLDRADDATLRKVRDDVQARLDHALAADEALRRHPPGLVVEARVDSTARIAFERECLSLVEARIAER